MKRKEKQDYEKECVIICWTRLLESVAMWCNSRIAGTIDALEDRGVHTICGILILERSRMTNNDGTSVTSRIRQWRWWIPDSRNNKLYDWSSLFVRLADAFSLSVIHISSVPSTCKSRTIASTKSWWTRCRRNHAKVHWDPPNRKLHFPTPSCRILSIHATLVLHCKLTSKFCWLFLSVEVRCRSPPVEQAQEVFFFLFELQNFDNA